MALAKIKKGDTVVMLVGSDRGKTGEVLRVLPDGRVLVEGLRLVTKHRKANPDRNIEGGRVQMPAPIDASNLALWDAETNAPIKVGVRVLEDGRRVRMNKRTQKTIDQ